MRHPLQENHQDREQQEPNAQRDHQDVLHPEPYAPAPELRLHPVEAPEPHIRDGHHPQSQHRHDAQQDLYPPQHRGAREVEIEPERLKDRQLQRRRPRPAAHGQGHREGGRADQKDHQKRAGQHRAQHRTL